VYYVPFLSNIFQKMCIPTNKSRFRNQGCQHPRIKDFVSSKELIEKD
jgi:hypothetical protein